MPKIPKKEKNAHPGPTTESLKKSPIEALIPELDHWAAYYDFIHQGLPGEAEYYVLTAARCGGEVLELGCGTGRICIPMAMTGVKVLGVDISGAMLWVCQEKYRRLGRVRGALQLVRADMRAFAFARKFRLIVMPYRTFMHLLSPLDQIQALHCVREHLDKDGEFLLNVWAARPSAITQAASSGALHVPQLVGTYSIEEEGITLRHYHAARYDEFHQVIFEKHLIQEVAANNRVMHEQALSLTRAWLSPREMEHLLVRCGFRVAAIYGDFDESPLDKHSTEMIWRLKRT